ncbi:KxYKxGKxW signal peptide domain-containing protein [Pediococcus pentosaceus CGMCC 7049]|uniref:KxYKxGKxW signal peptide domain-containing protein n=1 Tax=Pediococcus pentosaceus CGMCC 7049 TaxID=1460385 RepID=A0AAU7NMH6_PEDPE|nr:KxYKxGKxW signal peptide domain-containing protein [Pediococcus pentosaceus]
MHYKMYKDGKKWAFYSLTIIGLLVGLGTVNLQISANNKEEETVINDGASKETTGNEVNVENVTDQIYSSKNNSNLTNTENSSERGMLSGMDASEY